MRQKQMDVKKSLNPSPTSTENDVSGHDNRNDVTVSLLNGAKSEGTGIAWTLKCSIIPGPMWVMVL